MVSDLGTGLKIRMIEIVPVAVSGIYDKFRDTVNTSLLRTSLL